VASSHVGSKSILFNARHILTLQLDEDDIPVSKTTLDDDTVISLVVSFDTQTASDLAVLKIEKEGRPNYRPTPLSICDWNT
jgi:hypothetical protein